MKTVEVVRRALLQVPKNAVDLERVAAELTVLAKDGTEIPLYRMDRDTVYVPRNFPVSSILRVGLQPSIITPVRKWGRPRRRRFPVGKWGMTTQPRDDRQRTALKSLMDSSGEDRALVLGCGAGKTFIALAYACADPLRYPLLVVVPTTQLQDQWKRSILEHTSLKEEDVALVGGGHGLTPGPFITVGVLNSVSNESFLLKWGDYFRLVIFDEAHRLGAILLGKAAQHFTGERLSLTATIDRDDGMDSLYRHHLGRVAYEDVSTNLDPEVYFVRTGISINEAGYRWNGGPLQLPKLFNSLAKNQDRNKIAVNLVLSSVKSNRTVLVLGERVNQLEKLTKTLLKKGVDAELLTGRMPGESKDSYQIRTKASLTTVQVAFATSKLAKEGLDRAAFDTLLILYPFNGIGRLRQSIGRILRSHDSKQHPIVMILQDSSYDHKAMKREDGSTVSVKVSGALSRMTRRMYENLQALGYEAETVDP